MDKKVNKIVQTPDFDNEPETDDVISKIEQTKTALGDRSEERKKEAEELKKESEKIDKYLRNEDDVKSKEEEPMK